jgi:hypothetical protein
MAEQEIIPAGKSVGRPLTYSQAIADEICDRLASDEGLMTICADDHMPGLTTVYRWRREIDEFRQAYARAREDQGHTVADQLGEYRRKVSRGDMPADVARAAADMAKWEASRRASKDFGDKVQVESQTRNLNMGIPPDATAEAAAQAYERLVKGE